jgi:hypothetical protein
MNKKLFILLIAILLCAIVAISARIVMAQTGDPGENEGVQGQVDEDVMNYFPIQGRLTDPNGIPLNGTYPIAFRLYDVSEGGTALCQDTNNVNVTNGLFATEIWGDCQDYIKGEQLYLSIQVEGDAEMEPRQPIFAVPYAWSLRPGAVMIGSVGPGAMLHLENSDPSGRGLRAYSMSVTGVNYAIVAANKSPDGLGIFTYNTSSGVALRADSTSGVAIQATGTGIIQSSALSYLWVSGNGVRPYLQTDSTIINMDTIGGAKVTRGATVGNKNVMLPITISAPLYGQNVTISGLDLYFQTNTEFDGVAAVLLRKQTGVCSTSSCYQTILMDSTDYYCDQANNPTGCTLHWDLTSNNILSADSGILYLTIELTFSGSTTWVDIGGIRLTMSHE